MPKVMLTERDGGIVATWTSVSAEPSGTERMPGAIGGGPARRRAAR